MPIKSQLRLEQLTGSVGNAAGKIRTDSVPKTLALVGATDLSGSLSAIASALGRIHGRASNEAFNNVAGMFYQTIVPDSSGARDLGSATNEWGDLFIADDKKIQLGSDQDFTLEYDSAGGTNVALAEGASLRLAGVAQQLQFRDAGISLRSPLDGELLVYSDGTGAAALTLETKGGIKATASGSSTVALADGLLTLDLNGTDAVDGLLVDAEGSATIQAAAADSGAIILNAESANGLIQLQNQGAVKVAVSASLVSIHDQARVQDATAASALGTGALVVDGGASVGLDLYIGDDASLKSDGAVLNFGAGDDVKFTHDGTDGMILSSAGIFKVTGSSDVLVDAVGVVDFNSQAAAGLAGTALVLSASSGAINIDATAAVAIESSGGAISVGADNVAQNISIGTAGARTLVALGSSAATETQIEGTLVDVNWGASGGLFAGAGPAILDSTASAAIVSGTLAVALTGSSISFSTDGLMTSAGGPMAGNMAFSLNHDEFVTFRSKPIFSAGTSIIGAFNALATAAGGGTIGKAVITGSAVTKLQLTGGGMVDGGGFTRVIDLTEATPSNTEVYVNGQYLVSGTSAAGTNGDYGVDYSDPGAINFQFSLQADDVVVIKTTAEQ